MERVLSQNIFFVKLKVLLTAFITDSGYAGKWMSGALNGLLPCGMVYLAATTAAMTSHWYTSVIYMFCFGIGSLPGLILMPFIYRLTALKYKLLGKVLLMVVAMLFLIRGFGYSNWLLGCFGLFDQNACP